jgi:hypothetical protein
LSLATGLLISQGLANASCLQALTKDHLVKNGDSASKSVHPYANYFADVSVGVVTLVFRAYLVDQTMDHLSATLKRGGIKDLLAFFPPNKRDAKALEDHFRKEGLTQVAEWWAKKQYAVVKEGIVKDLREMGERDEPTEQVSAYSSSSTDEFKFSDSIMARSSLRSRPGRKRCRFLKPNLFSVSGKASWRPSIGAHVLTRSRTSPYVKLGLVVVQPYSKSPN